MAGEMAGKVPSKKESGGGLREGSDGAVRPGVSGSAAEETVREGAGPQEAEGAAAAPEAGSDEEAGRGPWELEPASPLGLRACSPGRRLVKKDAAVPQTAFSPQQRLLLLDTWQRSGLPAGDFGSLVGVSPYTLYNWKRRFDKEGPGGLMDGPRRGAGESRLPEVTRRTILMLKEGHPEYGCERISDMLIRGPALAASASAVARVLKEAGYELAEAPSRPHPDRPRSFERARPGEMWQSDLFTFLLKRQNRRVYLVAFMDDHSRFVAGYGLHASQSSALVLEVLRAAITSWGTPKEILTDNGTQYVSWRGKSAFARELQKRGIRHVISSPRHPQTLGKVERFWGTLWRECVEAAVFRDLEDARTRIGLFIDHYNFQRVHQGLDGLVPADRFFQAAPDVLRTLKARVAANSLELARGGLPRKPFYLTGQVGGQAFSVHAEGERVILTRPQGPREEIDMEGEAAAEKVLAEPPRQEDQESLPAPLCPHGSPVGPPDPESFPDELPPGVSPLDEGLRRIAESLDDNDTQDDKGEDQ